MKNNDRWDAEYYKKHSDIQFKTGMDVINSIEFNGNEMVLDVGCGDGRLTAEIANLIPSGVILGIDISTNMIQETKKSFYDISNVSFKCIDAIEFDIKNRFDIVVSFSAFHWIKNQQKVLGNIYASLKPGGRLFIKMSAVSKNAISDVLQSEKWRDCENKNNFQGQTPETIKPMLKRCGFANIDAFTKTNERIYETREELCNWLMGWLSHSTSFSESKVKEISQDIASAAKNDQGKFVLFGGILHVFAQKPNS